MQKKFRPCNTAVEYGKDTVDRERVGYMMKVSGERPAEMMHFLQPYMGERFTESCRWIQAETDTRAAEIWAGLKDTICRVLQDADVLQKQKKKGGIQYLAFSFMQYGVYMDRLEMRVEALDDNFYLDGQETAGFYRAEFLQDRYMEDLAFLKRKAGEKYVRMQDYELEEIKKEYAGFFSSVLLRMMQGLTGLVTETVKESGVLTTDRFMVLYGEYMERAVILYREEEKDEIFYSGNE